VINAFSGSAGADVCGVSELQAAELRTAPPMTADIEVASKDRREIAPCSSAFPPQAHFTPVRLADGPFAGP
jgi:hypothetical protein